MKCSKCGSEEKERLTEAEKVITLFKKDMLKTRPSAFGTFLDRTTLLKALRDYEAKYQREINNEL